MEDMKQAIRTCIEEQIGTGLKNYMDADAIELVKKLVLDAGFCNRMYNLYTTLNSGGDKPSTGGLSANVKSVRTEPGKGTMQVVLDIISTRESRLHIAENLSQLAEIYFVGAPEDKEEDDPQMDIEDYTGDDME